MKRTKDTFFEHISTKDYKTIESYEKRIANFEKYCLEQFDSKEIFDELKTDWPDILQYYINWLSKTMHQTRYGIISRLSENICITWELESRKMMLMNPWNFQKN